MPSGGVGRIYDLLIVGGGQAARRAAEGARAVALDLSIAILGEELHAPYERPPLSKTALEHPEGIGACEIRSRETYDADRIDLHLGQRAVRLDRVRREVLTETGDVFGYGRLILATGSRPRTLPFSAAGSEKLLTLRTRDDAERLSAQLGPGVKLVVIGAGFIGLEVASSGLVRGAEVTVLEVADRALGRVLPRVVGERIADFHRAAGVDLRLGVAVRDVVQDQGEGLRLETSAGVFPANVVVVGVGVQPNVELAAEAGLAVDDGILVAADGSTADPNVFAAGEVTRHPVQGQGAPVRLESWQVAELQAEAAGRSAAGCPSEHSALPWFWSDQLGHNIQVLGDVSGEGLLVVRDYGGGSASFFAMDSTGRLRGIIAVDAGRDIAVARRLLTKGSAPRPEHLENVDTPLRQLLV